MEPVFTEKEVFGNQKKSFLNAVFGAFGQSGVCYKEQKEKCFLFLIHKGQVSIDNLTELFKHVVSNSMQFQKCGDRTFVALS